MRILIVSEGKNEQGRDIASAAIRSPLETLVERLLGCRAEFRRERFSDAKVKTSIRRGVGDGLRKRVLGWIRHAQIEGFDAIVAVHDHDGQDERHDSFDQAQLDDSLDLPRALGIAVKTFGAWMLADERARLA